MAAERKSNSLSPAGRCAPVVFFIFNRPEKQAQVFAEIRKTRPRQLFVISDGPRGGVEADVSLVAKSRDILNQVDWDCELRFDFSESNLGPKERVTTGLNLVFSVVDRAIILEDDCLPDSSFFRFCTELLERYESEPDIALISGDNHLKGLRMTNDSYYFSWQGNTWGWATWARTWKGFVGEHGVKDRWTREERRTILARIPSLSSRISFGRMLRNAHNLDAWDIPFAVHCQERGYLSVVPEANLVTNIGFGADSTHTKFESLTLQSPLEKIDFPLRHPKTVEVNHQRDKAETRLFFWLRFSYPFRHPIEFVMRYVRYLLLIMRSKKAGETGALPPLEPTNSR